MEVFGKLILGLGLFFLGMRQVGANLRLLSGPSFRALISKSTGSQLEAGLMGIVFGALMQSATAVVFILVSMVSSGLIAPGAAYPVIIWTNVGLTALAFIVTLNIHPLVAYLVGFSAIMASLVRKPLWQALAGVLLGIGLIFFGLETMGSAAKPLMATPWFRDLLHQTTDSPAVAFLVGVAVAAVLQSNTASTMLVITLADAGAFGLDSALMLIYGTNLGAIALRLILAADLRGTSLQLVRFEDLFCLVSGAIMVILYYAESLLGVPLIRAAITALSSDLKTELALAFLLSNALPAVVITVLQGKCQELLAWLWPATVEEAEAKPKFISPHALNDPATAVDLLEREIARLLTGVSNLLSAEEIGSNEARHFEALSQLAKSIESFAAQLAVRPISSATATRLSVLREELGFVNYVKEQTQQFAESLAPLLAKVDTGSAAKRLVEVAARLLEQAASAMTTLDPKMIDSLREGTRSSGSYVGEHQQACMIESQKMEASPRLALLQSLGDLQMIAGLLHRLAKLLTGAALTRIKGE